MKGTLAAVCLAGMVSAGFTVLAVAGPGTGSGMESSQQKSATSGMQAGEMNKMQTPTAFNKASKLIGMEVRNPQGTDLGDIKDIVFDVNSGKVSYLVMSSGGVLGIGEKDLAVPLTAFTMNHEKNCLELNATRENISRAEGIGEHWPSVEQPQFGAMPFWQKPNPEQRNTGATNNP